jgi:hypothetical protein
VASDYWLYVKATDSRDAVSSMSYSGLQVTIVDSGQPVAAPTLISPADGATVTGTSVTFYWSAVTEATDYKLIVNTTNNLYTAGRKTSLRVGNTTTYVDTGYPATGTKYYWWVIAYDAKVSKCETSGQSWHPVPPFDFDRDTLPCYDAQ